MSRDPGARREEEGAQDPGGALREVMRSRKRATGRPEGRATKALRGRYRKRQKEGPGGEGKGKEIKGRPVEGT